MIKFKIGDKVKRIVPSDSPDMWGKVGVVYTVTRIENNKVFLYGLGNCTPSMGCFELIEGVNLPEELFVL